MNHVQAKGKPFQKAEETDTGVRYTGQLESLAPNGSTVGKLLMGLELGNPGHEDKLSIVIGAFKPAFDAVDLTKELEIHGPLVGRFLEFCGLAYLRYSNRGDSQDGGSDSGPEVDEGENNG